MDIPLGPHTLTADQDVPVSSMIINVTVVAPQPVVIATPTAGAIVTPTLTGTVLPFANVAIIQAGPDGNPLGFPVCQTQADSSGNWTCTTSALPAGATTLFAQAGGANGPPGALFSQDSVAFTIAQPPPVVAPPPPPPPAPTPDRPAGAHRTRRGHHR
ncbi:MAG TPA: hypothetical protein VFV67_31115 [Actinophytocola sp.]|uniref:hypothetical protein n=1 Tax=Actinophytocola sp. TaxID=1872138 RepID=UPI002DBA44FA|nr:hypothetical protein [Actinophytocola sp.]HEU5475118.1 hypothetical protein [Actinophytocola sp.]